MDIGYKLKRIQRWGAAFGYLESLKFEAAWSTRRTTVDIRVPGYPEPFQLRRMSSDLSVFETVFFKREFDLHFPVEPRLIIDGGANVGYSTAYFANRYPKAKVIAVEPSHDNAMMLRENCQSYKNVEVVEGGLWSESGHLRISNPTDLAWAFQCEMAPADAPDAFPAFSVDTLLDRSGFERCDLLKLDIEGAEEQLFSAPEKWLDRVDTILVEIHNDAALAAVKNACPQGLWHYRDFGEKILLNSRNSRNLPAND